MEHRSARKGELTGMLRAAAAAAAAAAVTAGVWLVPLGGALAALLFWPSPWSAAVVLPALSAACWALYAYEPDAVLGWMLRGRTRQNAPE